MIYFTTVIHSDSHINLFEFSKSVTSGNGDPEASNSMMNVSNVGEMSDGTATMDSHKSTNTHSVCLLIVFFVSLHYFNLDSFDSKNRNFQFFCRRI